MTREEQLKEIDELIARWSVSMDKMIDVLLVPPQLFASAMMLAARIRSGVPRAQARDEMVEEIEHLAERHPSMAEGLHKLVTNVRAVSI